MLLVDPTTWRMMRKFMYSLKSNSRRRIENFPYSCRGFPAININGTLCWNCVEENINSNLGDLLLPLILQLKSVGWYQWYKLPCWHINGSIEGLWLHCSFFYILIQEEDSVKLVDTWLLVQCDGEEETWAKLMSFNRQSEFYNPLTYSKLGT